MMTAFGRSPRTIFTTSGKRFRSSLIALVLSAEGPRLARYAAGNQIKILFDSREVESVTSIGSTIGQSAGGFRPRRWFSRIVLHASSSHSITASCLKPAFELPRARPPAPAKSSIDRNGYSVSKKSMTRNSSASRSLS